VVFEYRLFSLEGNGSGKSVLRSCSDAFPNLLSLRLDLDRGYADRSMLLNSFLRISPELEGKGIL